jgi:1-acyl-sn-glycerol-3-phosphate acyltransferase
LKIRGTLSIAVAAMTLVVADVFQRTIISMAVFLFPRRRDAILASWQQCMARSMLWAVTRIGGATVGGIPNIPARDGVLVLMNHQSLIDIPLVVRSLRPSYPRIVTRERYASGKPLISHMVRLYQYPTVNPRSTVRGHLSGLGEETAGSPVPVVIFPEGTRTRDGEVGRFKRPGLRAILSGRSWEVWLAVADGYWQCARLKDFRSSVSDIHGSMTVDGPITSPDPDSGPEVIETFIDEMENRMGQMLSELREPVKA